MPFSQILFLFRMITMNHIYTKKSCRKEKKSDYITYILSSVLEKASESASLKREVECSVTVEAVICIPLFLYASVCLIWMLELRVLQLTVKSALQEVGKELTVSLAEVPVLIPSNLEGEIINIIGSERLENSLITNGIQCDKSFVNLRSGTLELSAEYEVKLPAPMFVVKPLKYAEQMRMKLWNGYMKNRLGDWDMDVVVYVTDAGLVYHKNPRCTYLEPSVRSIDASVVSTLRNQSGAKYYPCGWCTVSGVNTVYITDYGTRYHGRANCSKIKRNVYAVSINDVKGKGACSKCGD